MTRLITWGLLDLYRLINEPKNGPFLLPKMKSLDPVEYKDYQLHAAMGVVEEETR